MTKDITYKRRLYYGRNVGLAFGISYDGWLEVHLGFWFVGFKVRKPWHY